MNGHVFSSELELKYYEYILTLMDGAVKDVILQPRFLLQEAFTKNGEKVRKIEYVADFKIFYTDGTEEIVDTKGFTTPDFKLKQKMFDYKYPDLNLRVLNYSRIDGGWVDVKLIEKNRKIRNKEKKKNKEIY